MPTAARILRFPTLSRTLVADKTYSLRLKLAPRKRRSVRRALIAGRRVNAKVVTRVRDDAGNVSVGRTQIRLAL